MWQDDHGGNRTTFSFLRKRRIALFSASAMDPVTLSDVSSKRKYAYWIGIVKIALGVGLFAFFWAAYVWIFVFGVLALVTGCLGVIHFRSQQDLLHNTCCCAPGNAVNGMCCVSLCNVVLGFFAVLSCVGGIITPYAPVIFAFIALVISMGIWVAECFNLYMVRALQDRVYGYTTPATNQVAPVDQPPLPSGVATTYPVYDQQYVLQAQPAYPQQPLYYYPTGPNTYGAEPVVVGTVVEPGVPPENRGYPNSYDQRLPYISNASPAVHGAPNFS